MASILRKISGLVVVEIPTPSPIDNNTPYFPPNPPGSTPAIPSPILPVWSPDTFKPLKDESISRPQPDGNPVPGFDDDWVLVFFPDNPLTAGDDSGYVRISPAAYEAWLNGSTP